MKHVIVELICNAEGRLVGRIETGGSLDAQTIVRGLSVEDQVRCPDRKLIMDGVQLTCGRCYQPLYFRGEAGIVPAMPGSAVVKDASYVEPSKAEARNKIRAEHGKVN